MKSEISEKHRQIAKLFINLPEWVNSETRNQCIEKCAQILAQNFPEDCPYENRQYVLIDKDYIDWIKESTMGEELNAEDIQEYVNAVLRDHRRTWDENYE